MQSIKKMLASKCTRTGLHQPHLHLLLPHPQKRRASEKEDCEAKAKKKLKLWLRCASVPNSGGKLKQRPLNDSVLTFGREKCIHRSSYGSDSRTALQASKAFISLGRARLHLCLMQSVDQMYHKTVIYSSSS